MKENEEDESEEVEVITRFAELDEDTIYEAASLKFEGLEMEFEDGAPRTE